MKRHGLLISGQKPQHQSLSASAAGAGGGELGVICVGARAAFGAGCFFGAAGGAAACAVGRAAGSGAVAAGAVAWRGGAADPGAPGSGIMMLTGGVDADEGKSAVVGLPDGNPPGSAAMAPPGGTPGAAIAGATGAFHEPE
jgi:hypothetical protein